MKRTVLAAVGALGFVLADAPAAKAQFRIGPVCRPGFGGFGFGNGFGFSYQRHGFRAAGFFGGFYSGFYSRSAFFGPVFGPPVAWSPLFPSIAPLTPWGLGPGFLQPGWGVGPGWGWNPLWGGIPGFWGAGGGPWGWNAFAPPVVVVPPPIIIAGGAVVDPDANPVMPAAAMQRKPDPGPRGDFLVIRPKKEKDFPPPGQMNPPAGRPVAAVPPPRAAFAFDPFAPPPFEVDRPDPDPAKETARLLKLGREAFAAGEYGKAGEQFDRAAAARPRAAPPRFLKAQAAFATGAYADAVTAIRAGLDLDPAWPAGTFDPKEPYGANAAAFAGHLADLRKAVVANPAQPTLEFLLAYELWFVGEKVEAKKWFEAAEKRLPAPGPIALFK